MPTVLDQLTQGLSDSGLSGLLESQLGNLGGVGTALESLTSHPPDQILRKRGTPRARHPWQHAQERLIGIVFENLPI